MLNFKTKLEIDLAGIKLKNPIIPASGCFAFGKEFARLYDLNILGGLAIKATSLEAREGNANPRVAETPAGMLNSIGLQNPGLKKVIEEELMFLQNFDTKIFANIVGSSIDEYCQLSQELSKQSSVAAIELNVSCPNVKDGIYFGSDENLLENLCKEVCKYSTKPVFVKLSPNVSNIVAIAKAAYKTPISGLSLINTLIGMKIDLKTRKPLIARGFGGLSGPAIKAVAIRMIYEVSQEIKLPIIGMGGIMNADDVLEFFYAGADAVGIGTANFIDPYICPKIIKDLEDKLAKESILSIAELKGLAWK